MVEKNLSIYLRYELPYHAENYIVTWVIIIKAHLEVLKYY